MKRKILTVIFTLLAFIIIFSGEKNTSKSSIQIILKLPKIDKNISTTSELHLPSFPYTPHKNIPSNFEVVDIKLDKGLNLKIKNISESNSNITILVNIVDREDKTNLTRSYNLKLKGKKIYSVKLLNEIFSDLEGKTLFAVISDENGNSYSYGFNQ
ncbi:MAG: hypothetical protein XD76_1327 [candidate division TA06 bacterium 32_111]|uniref:Uncharacterized protein n=2 Tax=Bacteria candidate phyla TaxID=1783234 RepID=A0A124G0B5_UNCT6|nr:MAG: hypothetical protein XD76_1327 [candidate division TA06 bacterium 32_111]KUK86951.1 MAG: hypothetical protein XE03_1169 [candidate division TA06 bacterium 34_109]HAF07418.1 hypothetical protein [candidate division WOR-3 bacterium]HCP16614.1 hypothetical protein [candidate division WOR-3 bacterium]